MLVFYENLHLIMFSLQNHHHRPFLGTYNTTLHHCCKESLRKCFTLGSAIHLPVCRTRCFKHISKREEVEAVTIIETPLSSDECRRRERKRISLKTVRHGQDETGKKKLDKEFGVMTKYCSVTRVIGHQKSDGCHVKHDRPNRIRQVSFVFCFCFGLSGVNKSWHTKNYPGRLTKGLRKVACIGAWHPSRVGFTVDRAGQTGYHHRTEINKVCYHPKKDTKIYLKISFTIQDRKLNDCLPQFSEVNNDFIMGKGCVVGAQKTCFYNQKVQTRRSRKAIELKSIDTTSKFGHWCFLTIQEKRALKWEEKSHI
uniref:Ribosomal protein L3 like n=1 Tax=Oryzias sinensis TaxID=183150 RepID=A0A8C7YXS5_9TELE